MSQTEAQGRPSDSLHPVAIIGAGPAGLTAAYLLAKASVPVTVLEADPEYVGGISRTARYKGFRFDIGGHRFFSKSSEVEDLWNEILGPELIERPRLSRIFYRGKFFSYPLKPLEAFANLGPLESALCAWSYLQARLHPNPDPKSFEDWVSNQFGARLFSIFFKTYTEKVWGMSCKEISADWAAQRIKGLSLGGAIKNALGLGPRKGIKTLIDSFRYPRLGPGQMWEACAAKVRAMGGEVLLGRRAEGLRYDESSREWVITYRSADGAAGTLRAGDVVSSAPMRELVLALEPRVSPRCAEAARRLRYRDFLTVALMARERKSLPDNWIYIHDPGVKVGRVQNFKAWSPDLVPDDESACYGLEYFCFEGDGLWSSSDEDLIQLAKTEIARIGLVRAEDVFDGCVVRQPKAYPVYDDDYRGHVDTIREELEKRYPRLHLVGRNGMHKYNNQDHSMMTAMLAARNIVARQSLYNLWRVNEDAEYHEAGTASAAVSGLRQVPAAYRRGA